MPYKDLEKRREASAKSADKWRRGNLSKAAEIARNWRYSNPKSSMYSLAKQRAKTSGIEFSISVDDIPDMPEVCPIFLVPFEPRRGEGKGANVYSPSLDRIDTTKGYVPGNLRIISYRANRSKSNMTLDEIERLYRYSRGEL